MTTLNVNTYHDQVRELIDGAEAPEHTLPNSRPLSLTTNFTWVLATCAMILGAVPLLAGWIAGMLLHV